jgi:hypothetical protein
MFLEGTMDFIIIISMFWHGSLFKVECIWKVIGGLQEVYDLHIFVAQWDSVHEGYLINNSGEIVCCLLLGGGTVWLIVETFGASYIGPELM